ncbi:MAG: hypothetical protein ABGZ53_06830 [Fuerstiella sp.]
MNSPINCFAAFAVLLCLLADTASAQENDRAEWQYQVPAGLRRIVDVGDGKWLLHFPNEATAELEELNRTTEYIELRNVKNRNVQRLYADRGLSQKEGKGPFRKFTDGKWAAPTNTNPSTDYRIRVVYFVPTDRQPLSRYEERIRIQLSLMKEIMTLDLRSKGYATEGPQFETKDGQIVVHLMRGEKTAREYNHLPVETSPEHTQAVFSEVDRRLGAPERNQTFIFAETYENGPARHVWPGHVAVAIARPPRGGIGIFSAWILRDEFCAPELARQRQLFFDETPIPGRKAIGHKGPNSPLNEFLEDGIGGALHELAHMLGLTHHGRGAVGSTNIMGQGFRNLRWNVGLRRNSRLQASFSRESGWMLMTSRYLNPEVDRTDNVRPKANVTLENKGTSIMVTVAASDDKQLSLLSMVEVTERDGRQLIEARRLSGTSATVRFRITPSSVTSRDPKLQFILVDGGGNHQKVSRSLTDGR